MASLAQQLEQFGGLGVFLLAAALTVLSVAAYRRERERRMLVVALAYGFFAVRGLVVFLEYELLPYLDASTVELLEHSSVLLVLAGLLAFFAALFVE